MSYSAFTQAFRRVLMLCSAMLAVFTANHVHGQGTMGAVPDPINARDLAGYGDRLGLSAQQRQSVESLHEMYREEFRALREGDLERTLREMPGGGMGGGFGGMGGMGAMNADRKTVEKSVRDLDAINNRIKAVDNTFFDQMQSMLTEEQTATMQRVRMMRERARFRTGLSRMSTFMNSASQVDLSVLVDDLDLSEQEFAQVDPLLATYESTLTAAARRLHEEGGRMTLEMLDKMKARGFDAQAMQDRERRGQMFETFRGVWSEVNATLQERAGEISTLNRKTLRGIAPLLESSKARRLRDDFIVRGYPEANLNPGQVNRAFASALTFEDLSAEQRAAVTALRDEHFAALDRINEQFMDVIDDRRKSMSMFGGDGEQRQRFEQAAAELRENMTTLMATADQSLRGALGPELAARLDQRLAQGDGGKSETVAAGRISFAANAFGGGGPVTFTASALEVTMDTEPVADPYLPSPISARELETYARRLRLGDDERTIMAGVHEEYLSRFTQVEETQYKTVRDLESKLWAIDPKTQQMSPPTAASIDNLYAARHSALETAIGVDASFFDDLAMTLLDSQAAGVARLRQARLRDLYRRETDTVNGMAMGMGGGPGSRGMRFNMMGGGSAVVDLIAVIDELTLSPIDQGAFDGALLEHETAIAVAMKSMYERNVRFQQRMDKLAAENAQANADGQQRGNGGGRGGPGGGAWRDAMETDGRAAREAKQAVIGRNQESLLSLKALLPEGDAETLRRAYNRKAYAEVFRDGRSAEPKLAAALQLPDLTDQQRPQVETIVGEFRANYDEICEHMIVAQANAPQFGGPGGNRDWQAMQEGMRAAEKLRFDRNDLNDRTVTRLRALLTDDQVQRLGGLELDAPE